MMNYTINMFIMSMISIIMNRKHLISCLISLEFMMMAMLMMMFIYCLMFESNFYLLIYMMTLMVCEAAMGLSILVSCMRLYSNDLISSMMLW